MLGLRCTARAAANAAGSPVRAPPARPTQFEHRDGTSFEADASRRVLTSGAVTESAEDRGRVPTMAIPSENAVWLRTLHDVASLTDQLVLHFIDDVATYDISPGTPIATSLVAITRASLEVAQGMLEGNDVTHELGELAIIAAGLAGEGVPIDLVLHGFHEGMRIVVGQMFLQYQDCTRETVIDGFQIAMTISDQLCMTVAHAYVGEHGGARFGPDAERTLTSALLAGQWTHSMARKCGITIAATYSVLAVTIREIPDSGIALHYLRKLRKALAHHSDGQGLARLSADGGTILIPAETVAEHELDALVAALAGAAQVELVAAVVSTPTADIASAAKTAHEILEVVERLACAPGLYRFDELALEYQLSRPGPGLSRLGELVAPLEQYPDLRKTLRVHIANNLNRAQTARTMNIHANTVDYRLRRIARLTGLNPARASDLWQLRAAMVARDCRDDSPRN
ncbi:helix-turn-helix domain-containing protein [Nocardia sp. PE-7]|uniref:PucR family transcriptional regulator n=1 Tax=Nocardia sp. PE-7 TaxID=3058426 RepID=UPI002657D01C|nr:helix-turn-helix domain-containing protein [Nocardia sp. PE-7]WKG12017.1 helix-turn-helix domain-containing protein [Nocardia sp. PE-7]